MSAAQESLRFDGPDVRPEDKSRLGAQLAKVRALTAEGQWWTLAALAKAAGCSEASASARLRDLRKPRNGGHTVERERVEGGLFRYRVVPRRGP